MIESHWIYIGLLFLVTGLFFFKAGGMNLWRNGWAVKKKLRTLEEMRDASSHAEDARALQIVISHAEAIRGKWILNPADLDIFNRSMELARQVASVYRPQSPSPAEEVRLGKLLDALLYAKSQTRQWNQNKTVSRLFNLRLRHLFFLAEAWEKKKNWDQSRSGRVFYKYRMGTVINWLYTIIRFMDISFWLMKMLIHWFRGYALKQLLLRWTLLAGETAYQLYREIDSDLAEAEEEKVWKRFDGMSAPETSFDLPPELQRIVNASRNELLFETSVLKKDRALEVYRHLAENIAHWHHPKSIEPLKEARLIDVAVSAGRLLDRIEALRDHPAAGHLFKLRLAHVLRAKGLADQWQESEVKEWADKYRLDTAVKISSLLYKVVRKHPATLFKTAALELLKESGKRWFYIYLHGKLAEETHRVYQSSARTSGTEPNDR